MHIRQTSRHSIGVNPPRNQSPATFDPGICWYLLRTVILEAWVQTRLPGYELTFHFLFHGWQHWKKRK